MVKDKKVGTVGLLRNSRCIGPIRTGAPEDGAAKAGLPEETSSISTSAGRRCNRRPLPGGTALLQAGDQLWVGQGAAGRGAESVCRSVVVGCFVIGVGSFLYYQDAQSCCQARHNQSHHRLLHPDAPSEYHSHQRIGACRAYGTVCVPPVPPGGTEFRPLPAPDCACDITCRPSLPEPAVPDHERWG